MIDFAEVDIRNSCSPVLETEIIPKESKTVGQSWAKANKDGTPDRRFANNYQIPIVEYETIHMKSPKGLNEVYMFSNVEKTREFSNAFSSYKSFLGKVAS